MSLKFKKYIACVGIVGFCLLPAEGYGLETLTYNGVTMNYTLDPISMYINGEYIDLPIMPPVQIDGTVLVPIREVFETLGAYVQWNSSDKTAYLYYRDTTISLEYGKEYAIVNGEEVELTISVQIINDKVMIPTRFVAEQMGFTVNWDGINRTVDIITPIYRPEVTPEIPEELEEEILEDNENEEEELEEIVDPDLSLDELLSIIAGAKEIYIGESSTTNSNISAKNYAQTQITNITSFEDESDFIVTVTAADSISDVEVLRYSDKLVLDITRSKNSLPSEIELIDNSYVEQIRTSQYETNVTRVVFDLIFDANIDISLDRDRNELILEFTQPPLEAIVAGTDNKGDYLVFYNAIKDNVKVSLDSRNDILDIEIDNMSVTETLRWTNFEGQFIERIVVTNKNNRIEATVTLEENSDYVYTITEEYGNVVVRIMDSNSTTEPEEEAEEEIFEEEEQLEVEDEDVIEEEEQPSQSLNLLEYYPVNNTLEFELVHGLNYNNITVTDLYRDGQIIIDLGANYSSYYSSGTLAVEGDEAVSTIQIINDGNTKFVINENTIYTYTMTLENDKVKVELMRPQEKYDKILMIDLGHGGTDPGAVVNGLIEKTLIDIQGFAVKELIESNTDIKVYMTREDDDTISLYYRPELANEIGVDLFVSFHNNSATVTSARGAEVHYYLDEISYELAVNTVNRIVEYTGMPNRGAKSSNFVVLRESEMPAILLEPGFMSNTTDAAMLASSSFTEKYAQAVYESIVEFFDKYTD